MRHCSTPGRACATGSTEDRTGNLLRQRLEEDGRAWEESDRDASLLYRGSRLERAPRLGGVGRRHLSTRSAVDFLAAARPGCASAPS